MIDDQELSDKLTEAFKNKYPLKPVDFNFFWEIVFAWSQDSCRYVSVHQMRTLVERLTTITASNLGLDPIEALHCGKTPNTDFSLTPKEDNHEHS